MTMTNFCTLFDSHYLTRGLAMYHSLITTVSDFHLYVYAFDDICLSTLKYLNYPKMTIVSLDEFENEQLLTIKPTRTRGEYCWTCASHTIIHALDTYSLPSVTYLDADLYFYSDPLILFEEFHSSCSSILLTEHRFSQELIADIKYGRYCVQFITFLNDSRGRTALEWWAERCREWCYARLENDKFGDQKYLDDWTERFEGVYVVKHPGAGVANWNVQQFKICGTEDLPNINGQPIIFFHFHGVKIYQNGICDLGYKQLPKAVIDLLYCPYLRMIEQIESNISLYLENSSINRLEDRPYWEWFISYLLRWPMGTFNVHKLL